MSTASTFHALLGRLPRMTAGAEAASFLALGGFFVANQLRVELSYTPLASGRDSLMARYEWWESACAHLTVGSAFFLVLPLIALQLLACAWSPTRSILTADRFATRLIVLTTLVGIPALLFLALVCSLPLGVGIVG